MASTPLFTIDASEPAARYSALLGSAAAAFVVLVGAAVAFPHFLPHAVVVAVLAFVPALRSGTRLAAGSLKVQLFTDRLEVESAGRPPVALAYGDIESVTLSDSGDVDSGMLVLEVRARDAAPVVTRGVAAGRVALRLVELAGPRIGRRVLEGASDGRRVRLAVRSKARARRWRLGALGLLSALTLSLTLAALSHFGSAAAVMLVFPGAFILAFLGVLLLSRTPGVEVDAEGIRAIGARDEDALAWRSLARGEAGDQGLTLADVRGRTVLVPFGAENASVVLAIAGDRVRPDLGLTGKWFLWRAFASHCCRPMLPPARRFALAIGAPLAYAWEDTAFRLATLATREEHRSGLVEHWLVKDEKSAREVLAWLAGDGDHRDFEKRAVCIRAGEPDPGPARGAIDPAKATARDSEPIVRKCLSLEGGILAWDLCRLSQMARACFVAGYIREDEAWAIMLRTAREAQRAFSSWGALVDSYLAGWRYFAALGRGGGVERADAMRAYLLSSDGSPWPKTAWKTPLDEAPGARRP